MKKKEINKIFTEVFEDLFRSYGYQNVNGITYCRKTTEIDYIVSFAPYADGKRYRTGLGFGIRISQLEQLRKLDIDDGYLATVAQSINDLKNESKCLQWVFASKEDLIKLKNNVENELLDFGFPFFEAYPSSLEIFNNLNSNDSNLWFNCSGDSRNGLLVLLTLLRYNKEKAYEFGKLLFGKYEGMMPKYSYELNEALRVVKNTPKL